MSAKTLMANESLLQQIEEQVKAIRKNGGVLARSYGDPKFGFAEGVERVQEYEGALAILREVSAQIYSALDVCDPEDNELLERESEDEEEDEAEEGDGDDEEDEDEDGDEEEGEEEPLR